MEQSLNFTDSIDPEKWNTFVYDHKFGNIFQTYEFRQVIDKTNNRKMIPFASLNSNGEIISLVQGSLVSTNKYFGKIATRLIIQGGPLYLDNPEEYKSAGILMEKYDLLIKEKAISSEIRNIFDFPVENNLAINCNYEKEEHLNYLIYLKVSEDDLWSSIHKSRRKGITRAKKDNIEILELNDISDIPEFYNLIKDTYNRVKMPVADISIFNSAYEILVPKNMAKFYVARLGDKIIGARAVLLYKDQIYDWYAGSSSAHTDLTINEALVWHVLKYGSNNGYRLFDFGGAGKPDEEYGVREFKRRFGGTEVNFGRYIKTYSPTIMNIIKKGFNIYRKHS